MLDVIATPSVKSASLLYEVAPTIASLLVRTWWPSDGDRSGNHFSSLARSKRSIVPRTPAATMTMGARQVLRPRLKSRVLRKLDSSYPRWAPGAMRSTWVSG